MIHSSSNLLINREWSMPNSNTFDIKPIHTLISKYIELVKTDNPNAVIKWLVKLLGFRRVDIRAY